MEYTLLRGSNEMLDSRGDMNKQASDNDILSMMSDLHLPQMPKSTDYPKP